MPLQQVGATETLAGISRLTREYLYWRLTSGNNLSGVSASVAFAVGTSIPGTGDWRTAAIVADPDEPASSAVRLMVGPGSLAPWPNPGTEPVTYRVWIMLNNGVEEIVRNVGTIVVR
jgi:hypothetical protein